MVWTTPKTDWTTGELVSAEDMNAVGENLAVLGNLRSAVAACTTTEDIVAINTDFADVDSNNLSLTITTSGGDVLVHFEGSARHVHSQITGYFDIDVDGNRQGGENGIMRFGFNTWARIIGFTRLVQNLSAGTHTFRFQWKSAREGIRLYAGAQFWVREI